MIELIIKQYLDSKLSVPVYLQRQNMLPPFVLFEKTGSSLTNLLPSSTFAFQSYGLSLYDAAKLNMEVKRAVIDMIELDEIAGVRLNSDYNFTDTETKEYRYQAVFDIRHYEEDIA